MALENPIVIEALNAWEQEITESWKTSPLRDVDGREKLRLMLEAASHFRLHLTKVLQTGQMQQIQQRSRMQKLRSIVTGRAA
jgi:hypothetical protein